MEPVIQTESVTKTYFMAEPVHALRGVSIQINKGEFVSLMGASGSGKSTLMNILGCLDRPTDGQYHLDGSETSKLTKNQLAGIRNEKLGFVFQGFNLLSRTTALENVELPLIYNRGRSIKNPKEKARACLERVGLGNRLDHLTHQLSGGQQQRVAVARALVNDPALILADEPTGNLDSRTSLDLMALFQELNGQGITILLVTHEPDISRYGKRVIEMRDGLITQDQSIKQRRNATQDLENFEGVTGI